MSDNVVWPTDAPRAGDAHGTDVLTHILREMALQVALPDPQSWGPEEVDQDPLSPESLGAQTSRLLKLIERARDEKDVSLLHSLRRELLLTRWALVKSRPVRSRGAAEKRAGAARARFQTQPVRSPGSRPAPGRRSEASPACVPNAATSRPPLP